MANSIVCQRKWKPIVEPRRAKPKTYRQTPTHWLEFYEEAVIVWGPNHRRALTEWSIAINNGSPFSRFFCVFFVSKGNHFFTFIVIVALPGLFSYLFW